MYQEQLRRQEEEEEEEEERDRQRYTEQLQREGRIESAHVRHFVFLFK